MATIKSFTSIEQSKKLSEILPLESADMYYFRQIDNDYFPPDVESICPIPLFKNGKEDFNYDIRCWSLAALRNLLPTAIRPNKDLYLFESHNTFDNSWVYRYYNEDDTSYLYCKDTNEVDACFEMIIKLKENKLI